MPAVVQLYDELQPAAAERSHPNFLYWVLKKNILISYPLGPNALLVVLASTREWFCGGTAVQLLQVPHLP